MRFREAVLACSEFQDVYRDGLRALGGADRSRIDCARPRRLAGSVDVDKALARRQPNAPRWDYGIGVSAGSRDEAIWVEVHPANAREVGVVIEKAAWLRKWLGANARDLLTMTRDADGFIWLATRGVSIQRGSRQGRQLALAGVSFPRSRLRLS